MKLLNAKNTALLTILTTSACCLPALVLLAFSVGSVTLGATLARYHWWFLGAGIGMLTLSYWLYFRERKACSRNECRMRNRALTLTSMALATAVVAAFAINSLAPLIAHAGDRPIAESSGDQRLVIIPVEGMTCFSCELHVEKVLKDLSGVLDAEASTTARNVQVTYNPETVSVADLVQAINIQTGYRAGQPAPSVEKNP